MESIHIEQNVLKEAVGSQDQVSAAYGGLNRIDFHTNGEITVTPLTVSGDRMRELNSHLMLFYTGVARTSSEVQTKFVENLNSKKRQLRIMKDLVDESIAILNSRADIVQFGELLHEAWDVKRGFSSIVSNPEVDDIHADAMAAGAIGGKLTGAGGGGFLLLFVPPEKQAQVKSALSRFLHVPFKFEFGGSQIIFSDRNVDYDSEESTTSDAAISPFREVSYVDA